MLCSSVPRLGFANRVCECARARVCDRLPGAGAAVGGRVPAMEAAADGAGKVSGTTVR